MHGWMFYRFKMLNCHISAAPASVCSPSSLVQATPTTFGDLRLANGHSAQRRRVTSGPPPSGLQDWLHTFQVSTRTSTFSQIIQRLYLNKIQRRTFNSKISVHSLYAHLNRDTGPGFSRTAAKSVSAFPAFW